MSEEHQTPKPVGSLQPLADAFKKFEIGKAMPAMDPAKAQMAYHHAMLLAGCYRKDDAADPEIYGDAIAAVLSQYPAEVVKRVTDPRTGLPSRLKWLPSVPEVQSACEEIYGPIRRAHEWEQGAKRQLEERKREEARAARPNLDELKAKYGPNWGLNTEGTEEERERRQKHLDSIAKANKRVFEAECEAAGIDPAKGVSPSLLKIIEAKRASDAA